MSELFNIKDIIMYFAYVSPEGSSIYNTREEKDGIIKIQNDLETLRFHYPDCYLLLAGDLNARTKDLLDYLPDDDLSHIFGDTDYDSSTFCTARNNRDSVFINNFGKSLVTICCLFDVHILNGRFSNDINGEYTCNANDGVSVVDYIAASTDLFPYISNFEVLDIDESDHFPITCTLSLKRVQNDSLTPQRYAKDSICIQERQTFKWNEIHKIEFQSKTAYLLQIKREQLTHEIPLDIDKAISTLLSIYYEAGSNMLVRPYKVKSSQPV